MRNFSKNTIKRYKKLEKSGQILTFKIESTNGGLVSDAIKLSKRLQKISSLWVEFSIHINCSGGYVGNCS